MTNRKTAIITGYSSGLGAEMAKGLIESGYLVIGVSRRQPQDDVFCDEHQESIVQIRGDASDPETVAKAFESAGQKGNLDVVISCAGRGVFGPAGSYTADDVENVLRANLTSLILFSDAAVNALKESGGKIVNIMSTSSNIPRPHETIYCAAKWGARGYTESLRAELKETDIHVIAVYPGGMNTAFWNNAIRPEKDPKSFMNPEAVAKRILSAITDDEVSYVSDIVINRP